MIQKIDISTVGSIARAAQQKVKRAASKKGLMVIHAGNTPPCTPTRMLHVIALALDMSPACYRMKNRSRDVTELRHIGAMLLRSHFPLLTLMKIAAFFDQDHSTIVSGMQRAYSLLYTKDNAFVEKYNAAVSSVEAWLRKEDGAMEKYRAAERA